jgi:hypothetical protein
MSLKRLQTMQKKLRRNSTGNLRKVGTSAATRANVEAARQRIRTGNL